MDELELLVDLHKDALRQGPGSDEATGLALRLAGLDDSRRLAIADIGCGTGASTLTLARALDADITAVDFLPEFLDVLQQRAQQQPLRGRITPLCASMGALPFADESLDVIWAEGAIYNIGFEEGITAWRRYLKPGGLLVVSEITWLTDARPGEIDEHWHGEYPEIATASAKIALLEKQGYVPEGYFVLPEACWLEHYYRPIQQRLPGFVSRNGNTEGARAIARAEEREIALYEQYGAYYSYGVYIARLQA